MRLLPVPRMGQATKPADRLRRGALTASPAVHGVIPRKRAKGGGKNVRQEATGGRRTAGDTQARGKTLPTYTRPLESLRKRQSLRETTCRTCCGPIRKPCQEAWAREYLKRRGIPLEVATRCGVGYAAPGTWAHPARDWKWGRLVFPHTDPSGRLVNLYGRAVGSTEKVPKSLRHDHLPGRKRLLQCGGPSSWRGAAFCLRRGFDALALIAAGCTRVVATFGVDGWRWEWARDVRELVFAMDADEAGGKLERAGPASHS